MPPKSNRRAWRRVLLYGVPALLGLTGLIALGAFGAMRSNAGRQWLADTIETVLSTPGAFEVLIGRLDGALPQEVRLTGLRLSDAGGTWLSAESLALDWAPLALFSDQLQITSLRAEGLVLERLPEGAGPEEPATPGGLPSLPFEIAVERLSVADLTLGEALLGRRGRFRIEGRAAAKDAEGIATTLSIERSDGAAGRARLEALYRPRDDRLRLEASIEEPADGLIARLSDLPGLPAVQARLDGDGVLSDWRGRLSLRLEGLLSLRSQIELRRDEAFQFEVTGQARLEEAARILPPEVPEALVAGELGFALKGSLHDNRDLEIAQAWIDSSGARLALSGKLGLDTLASEAEVTLELLDPALAEGLIPGLRAEGLTLTAKVAGPVMQPQIDAHLRVAGPSAPGLAAKTLEARLAFSPGRPLNRGPPEGAIRAEGAVADLAIEGLDALAPLTGGGLRWTLAGRLEREGTRFEAESLSLETGPARLTASGTLDLRDETFEAAASLTLADLAGLSPLLGLELRGGARIEAWIESSDLGQSAAAVVTGELRELALEDPVLNALLGGASSLAANLSLATGGRITARDIALDTPAAKLSGNLAAATDFARIEADYDLSLPKLGVLSGPLGIDLAGRATLRGRAEGAIANPGLSGRADFAKARIQGVAIERAEVAYTVDDPAGKARGKVTATATTDLGEFAADTDYLFAAPDLRLTKLQAQSRGATLRGEVTVPIDGRPLTGSLQAAAPDLAPWLALAGLAGGGAAKAEIELTAEGPRQGAGLSAEVTRPLLRLDADRELRGQTAKIEATAADLTGTPKGRARLHAAGVVFDELSLDQVSLEVEGGTAALDWRLAGDGAWRGPLSLRADGRLETSAREVLVEIAHLKGRALERDLALRAPVALTQSAATMSLGPLDLSFGDAAIAAQGEIDSAKLSGRLAIDALPLASLAAVLPTSGLNGTLSANLQVAGARANPTGGGEVRVSGIDMESVLQGPSLDLSLDTAWRDGRLRLTGALSGLPGPDVELAADLPLRLDPAALVPVLGADEAVSARVGWRGEMASLWPLVPLDGHRLSGDTEVSLSVAGTLARPRANGIVSLSGGAYENLDAGTLLKDLNARIEFDDQQARIANLSASDGAQGSLSASGEIALDAGADFPFSATARMTDFIAVRRDEVSATSDGAVTLKGTLGDILVAGRFETKTVEIRIVDSLPPEVVALNVIETGASPKGEAFQRQGAKHETDSIVRLDLAVDMPRRVFVRGRGLDSEWAGNLRVAGSAAEPKVLGEVKLVRGQLTLLTKTFRLTEGEVRFPPGVDAVPELNVTAEHKAGDIVAIAKVSGPATNPEITLSSEPELPQDEVVSRVLFGKKRGQLSAFEGAQLAVAVAELTGAGGGTGVLDVARNLIGVDVLRVEGPRQDGTGGPSIEAGKYAAEGVYVGVKKGVTDQTGAVAVEIELTPNISVESETGTTGESDIGVKFKWDY